MYACISLMWLMKIKNITMYNGLTKSLTSNSKSLYEDSMAFLGSFFCSNRGLNSVITSPGDIACTHLDLYNTHVRIRLTYSDFNI